MPFQIVGMGSGLWKEQAWNDIFTADDAVAGHGIAFGVGDDGADPLGLFRDGVDVGFHDLQGEPVLVEFGELAFLIEVGAKRRRKLESGNRPKQSSPHRLSGEYGLAVRARSRRGNRRRPSWRRCR